MTPVFSRQVLPGSTPRQPDPGTSSSAIRGHCISLLTLVLAFVSMPVPGRAQAGPAAILVTPESLSQQMDDPNLVLLHVGAEEEYATEHIPGAYRVEMDAIAAPESPDGMTGLNLQMPEPGALARTLGAMGIGDDTRVVVYFGNDWVTPAARVLYTLEWIGLGSRALFLDGGMPAWKALGLEVTATPSPPPTPRTLTPAVRQDLVVTAGWVRDNLSADGLQVIDARAPVHFNGIQASNLHREPVRKGHIPGASNVPFNQIVTEDLHLKSPEDLESMFRQAGVQPGDTVVGYCHLGQWATLMLLGARVAGHPVKLYDGSFQEWGSREDLPVENPGGGG